MGVDHSGVNEDLDETDSAYRVRAFVASDGV